MVQPSYTIELINEKKSIETIEQLLFSGVTFFGATGVAQKLGQEFKATKNTTLDKVTIWLAKNGSPTDSVQCKLYASDATTLIATAKNTVLGSSLPTQPTTVEIDFFFPKTSLLNGVVYFLEFSRTGALGTLEYAMEFQSTGNPYVDGRWARMNSGVWSFSTTFDQKFKVTIETILIIDTTDITDDVSSIQRINIGLNQVYGSIKQGETLLTLNNDDSKYSPLNSSSSLFGKFRLNNRIRIKVLFDAVTYVLFTGIINNIEPKLDIDKRFVDVRLLDLLSRMTDLVVSIGAKTGKTASELIELLFEAAGFVSSDYDVQFDAEVLQDVTWNDVNLISKLNEIVSAGQHYHFIDGTGTYIFKNNQFLSDNTPLITYTEPDPDAANLDFKLSDINNLIKVQYNGGVAKSEDLDSRELFGERLFQLDNDLLGNVTYAQFIADYILELRKDAGNILNMDLSLTYPDIFQLNFGDVIRFEESFHKIANDYNVLEKTLSIIPSSRKIAMNVSCRKFVFPPDVGTFVLLEPFQGDQFISLASNGVFAAQSFKVVNNGEIYKWTWTVELDFVSSGNKRVEIYNADVNDFPTGTVLAQSNFILFPSGVSSGSFEFTFSESERPTLNNANKYVVVFNVAGSLSPRKIWGKNSDVYANGKPSQYITTIPGYQTLHPNEFYFKAVVKEV